MSLPVARRLFHRHLGLQPYNKIALQNISEPRNQPTVYPPHTCAGRNPCGRSAFGILCRCCLPRGSAVRTGARSQLHPQPECSFASGQHKSAQAQGRERERTARLPSSAAGSAKDLLLLSNPIQHVLSAYRRESGMRPDCKHQSAPDRHTHLVEHNNGACGGAHSWETACGRQRC